MGMHQMLTALNSWLTNVKVTTEGTERKLEIRSTKQIHDKGLKMLDIRYWILDENLFFLNDSS